jgi:hypothetical protein
MDQELNMVGPDRETQLVDPQRLDRTSLPFVGRWNQLVSNANWEKGRIIHQWREALRESGAPATEYSDDAWSRRVGGVTGQHVGRLRRVYQRFGLSYPDYVGLFWSHFQASIEWDDAEMWLEGAVHNGWSVSQMRHQRSETLGTLGDEQPGDDDVVGSELDEDFEPAHNAPSGREVSRSMSDVQSGPRDEGPDFGDQERSASDRFDGDHGPARAADNQPEGIVDFVRPFAELTELPEDLSAAFEAFKLAILRHKMDDWRQVAREDVLASLEALRQLVVASL